MIPIKRILVPIDFSPVSDIAFDYAVAMGARFGSTLELLHVVDNTGLAAAYPDGYFVELPGVRDQMIADATARLKDIASRCAALGVPATAQVAVGAPASVITEIAAADGTDLIVMGTHGRRGLSHLVLGSVAERVVRTAPCPVMAVRDTARVADTIAADVVSRKAGLQPA